MGTGFNHPPQLFDWRWNIDYAKQINRDRFEDGFVVSSPQTQSEYDWFRPPEKDKQTTIKHTDLIV